MEAQAAQGRVHARRLPRPAPAGAQDAPDRARRPARYAARRRRAGEEPEGRRAPARPRRGDHPLDDAGRAAQPADDRRLPPPPHRRRQRLRCVQQVNQLLGQFKQVQKMMRQIGPRKDAADARVGHSLATRRASVLGLPKRSFSPVASKGGTSDPDPLAHPERLTQSVYAYVAYRIGSGPTPRTRRARCSPARCGTGRSSTAPRGRRSPGSLGIARRVLAERAAQNPPTVAEVPGRGRAGSARGRVGEPRDDAEPPSPPSASAIASSSRCATAPTSRPPRSASCSTSARTPSRWPCTARFAGCAPSSRPTLRPCRAGHSARPMPSTGRGRVRVYGFSAVFIT